MEQKEEVERWPQLKKKKRRSLSVERLRGLFSFKSSPKAKAKAKAAAPRGRCGEYAWLLFRLVGALGYPARWVVDWQAI